MSVLAGLPIAYPMNVVESGIIHFQYSDISVNWRLSENRSSTPETIKIRTKRKTKKVAENRWDKSLSLNSFFNLAVSKPSSLALIRLGTWMNEFFPSASAMIGTQVKSIAGTK